MLNSVQHVEDFTVFLLRVLKPRGLSESDNVILKSEADRNAQKGGEKQTRTKARLKDLTHSWARSLSITAFGDGSRKRRLRRLCSNRARPAREEAAEAEEDCEEAGSCDIAERKWRFQRQATAYLTPKTTRRQRVTFTSLERLKSLRSRSAPI